ncbi:MAG: hypothetical protein HYU75_14210, partial [Betaproteobacteria bacterium]|nr:hypothetical protein [Betaproteobacteria bacterium]
TLSGAAAGNYALTSTTATASADITPAPVTASVTAANKVYNGTATASTTCSLSGVTGSDSVSCSAASSSFANALVGNAKTVTATGITLSGAAATNYSLTSATTTTSANITPAPVFASVTAANKVYNGTATATITGCSLSGVIGSDGVTCSAGPAGFADGNVGNAKTATATGITLSGAAAANYALTSTTATTSANITPAPVTASVTAANKVYDGTTAATIVTCSLAGVVGTDDVACSSASGSFADGNVGNAKTAAATGITLSGTAAGNYLLTSTTATASANITAASVTAAVTAANKVYDGTTAATIVTCSLSGIIGSDSVTCASASATFADAEVGSDKTVTASGISLSGTAAGNYALASTTATTSANIVASSEPVMGVLVTMPGPIAPTLYAVSSAQPGQTFEVIAALRNDAAVGFTYTLSVEAEPGQSSILDTDPITGLVSMRFTLPASAGNEFQGATSVLKFVWTAAEAL